MVSDASEWLPGRRGLRWGCALIQSSSSVENKVVLEGCPINIFAGYPGLPCPRLLCRARMVQIGGDKP